MTFPMDTRAAYLYRLNMKSPVRVLGLGFRFHAFAMRAARMQNFAHLPTRPDHPPNMAASSWILVIRTLEGLQ